MTHPIDNSDTVPAGTTTHRSATFKAPRRRWPGLLFVAVAAAGLAAFAVSSIYDRRSVGEKIDATVQATTGKLQDQVDDLRLSASAAARDGARVGDRAATALNDAGITAAVKAALAADPSLSAVKIAVNTEAGVVSLEGPAPDNRSRERAEVLAAAPSGVLRVDNRLVVSPPPAVTPR